LDREPELTAIRRAYAKQILSSVGADNARLEDAYAAVRREAFLGTGPWQLFRAGKGYVETPSDDPAHLYSDVVVGIWPERQINNGQPALHAALIASVSPKEGEHVVHIGAGVGYYSAIMAELVGPSGRVTAIEYEPELAARSRVNLAAYPNVEIVEGDGAHVPFDGADVIYVNAGATGPAHSWLDRLADRGRLILPLTTDKGFGKDIEFEKMSRRGAVFRIERQGPNFLAKWILPVAIFPCVGGRDEESEKSLAAAFDKGGMRDVTRLYRDECIPDDRCWLRGRGWCLAYS
jgi:protein-L-isoaspartate(D-aspartate) O-methyltransferase